jgi:hypothetical protein
MVRLANGVLVFSSLNRRTSSPTVPPDAALHIDLLLMAIRPA